MSVYSGGAIIVREGKFWNLELDAFCFCAAIRSEGGVWVERGVPRS